MPVGHGGKGETQLILGSYPAAVRMEALNEWQWNGKQPEWLNDAWEASSSEGRRWMGKLAVEPNLLCF